MVQQPSLSMFPVFLFIHKTIVLALNADENWYSMFPNSNLPLFRIGANVRSLICLCCVILIHYSNKLVLQYLGFPLPLFIQEYLLPTCVAWSVDSI